MVNPIFAIFIVEKIEGGSVVVGVTAAVFWIVQSLLRIPTATLFGLKHQINGVFEHSLHFSLKDIFNRG